MSELNVSNEACAAFLAANADREAVGGRGDAYYFGLRAAASLIVAGELRRLVGEIAPRLTVIKTEADCAPSGAGDYAEGSARALECIVAVLVNRADELEVQS